VSARSSLLPLLLVVLGGLAAAQPSPRVHRIELGPTPGHPLPELSIRPGTASLLLFDAPLARDGVELEAREHFHRVVVGEDTLTLLPSEALREGSRVRLRVRFAEGACPAEARFVLVVVSGQADVQVEVITTPSASPVPKDSTGMAAELRRLQEENARLRAERAPSGLTGAIADSWMRSEGIVTALATLPASHATDPSLQETEVRGFRAATRVAVELRLKPPLNGPPWTAGRAVLVDSQGRPLRIIQVWQSATTATQTSGIRVIVEAEAGPEEATGPCTLELWDAEEGRTLTVSRLIFPKL
jgi:uncharacterized protein (TIGR02268 family)